MIVRRIKENELMEARNISALSFDWVHDTKGMTAEEYIRQVKEKPASKADANFKDTYAAFTEEGDMMSCLNVLPFEVSFDNNRLKMAGIGGVCSYPQYRRQGAVRELFRLVLTDMYERGVAFSYLYPFSEKFYANYGYAPSSASIRWSFDLTSIPVISYEGTFHLYRGEGDYSDYEQIYLAFAKKYNMMVHRDNFDWSVLKNANPFKGKRQAYLYKDRDGNPKGYFIFEKSEEQEQPIMDCKEIIFDSFITLKAIMSFIKSFSSHYNKVAFHAPRNLSLEYFCLDYSQSASQRQLRQNGMVRVINAAKVLEQANFRGDGELYIQILDSCLENNNKVFHVIYRSGKADKVTAHDASLSTLTETTKNVPAVLSPDKKEADIVMTINQFSAAILGNYDVMDLDYLEGVTLNCSKEKAAQLIYKKPNWINNYF